MHSKQTASGDDGRGGEGLLDDGLGREEAARAHGDAVEDGQPLSPSDAPAQADGWREVTRSSLPSAQVNQLLHSFPRPIVQRTYAWGAQDNQCLRGCSSGNLRQIAYG